MGLGTPYQVSLKCRGRHRLFPLPNSWGNSHPKPSVSQEGLILPSCSYCCLPNSSLIFQAPLWPQCLSLYRLPRSLEQLLQPRVPISQSCLPQPIWAGLSAHSSGLRHDPPNSTLPQISHLHRPWTPHMERLGLYLPSLKLWTAKFSSSCLPVKGHPPTALSQTPWDHPPEQGTLMPPLSCSSTTQTGTSAECRGWLQAPMPCSFRSTQRGLRDQGLSKSPDPGQRGRSQSWVSIRRLGDL